MKRLLATALFSLLATGCIHPWVGQPVKQLERKMGLPYSIRNQGDTRVYYYPDTLAGRGQITFTVDKQGIIRDWWATPNVPGPYGDNPFGDIRTDDFGTVIDNGTRTGPLPVTP